jgi:hypothetical protein
MFWNLLRFLFGLVKLGIVFGLVAGVSALVVAALLVPEPDLSDTGRDFARRFIVDMARHWDTDRTMARMTPRLRQKINRDEVDAVFQVARQIGEFQGLKSINGEITFGEDLTHPLLIKASYIAGAQFAQGRITFQVDLKKEAEGWAVDGLFIASQGVLDFIRLDTDSPEKTP